jgi:hypothetical protein
MAPGSLQGKWQHSWPTTRWRHHTLLCGEDGLVHLRVMQEPKLGLDHPKPVIATRGSPASVKSGRLVAMKSP